MIHALRYFARYFDGAIGRCELVEQLDVILQALNGVRSKNKDFQSEEDGFPIDVEDWAPNPEELYRATELRQILRKTLEELSHGLRVVFVLRDMEGLSLEQTAESDCS